MQTLFEVTDQRFNNRTLNFSNQSATIADGSNILLRLRVTNLSTGASLSVTMNVTFPGGKVKRFDFFANALGSYERGGWSGVERGGALTASGTITAVGRVTFDASIIAFDRAEDVPEWSL